MATGKTLHLVWVDVDEGRENKWSDWMRDKHVPEVVVRGHFLSATCYRNKRSDAPAKYFTISEAKVLGTLETYLNGPAKELREDFVRRFGNNVRITRIILERV